MCSFEPLKLPQNLCLVGAFDRNTHSILKKQGQKVVHKNVS